jgi:bifunctional DNA-binding transcriptional regulator/antitoxin component of YhaV-PrlF toxin-antitoxin module
MAFYSKISSQGQISVPAQVRLDLVVEPGSVLCWEKRGEGYFLTRRATCRVEDFWQIAKRFRLKRPPTIEEMDEAIALEIEEKHGKRGR